MTSGKTGSKSASTCLCKEGYYLATGVNTASKLSLTPCTACPIGKYSNQAGLTACTPCTNFTNTSSQVSRTHICIDSCIFPVTSVCAGLLPRPRLPLQARVLRNQSRHVIANKHLQQWSWDMQTMRNGHIQRQARK